MEEFSPQLPDAAPRPLIADRFERGSFLKESNGVHTYLGHDRKTGRAVIVKSVSQTAFPAGAHHRLRHEASVLAQVKSERLAAPLYFNCDASSALLIYPRIDGITLADRLRRGPLTVSDALHVAEELLTALREVHEFGILHGDIKPSNVIVSDEIASDRVVLIDFGFACSRALHPTLRGLTAGTAAYLAPERAGLIRGGFDERSDLYSAGVLLYETLSGACPFAGRDIGEVLRQHVTRQPERLRERGLPVPRALDDLLARLIAKDPRDRYQSAAGALDDIRQLNAALAAGIAEPQIPIGKHDRRRVLTEPAFIGRRAELARLRESLEALHQGYGGMVFVEAESGGGKTRFLEEAATAYGHERPCGVYFGQGLDQAAQRPFQVLAGVAEAVARELDARPERRAELRAAVGDRLEALLNALPELRTGLSAGSAQALGPEDFGEIRNVLALVTFLDALGTAERPALVILDDCQWADELTLRVLQAWQRERARETARPCHLLILVAFRSEEVRLGHVLRRIEPTGRIVLPPFGESEVRELVESMAGSVPREATDLVVRLSQGSPFMASAVLRGLVESEALMPERPGWRLESDGMFELRSSQAAAAFLARRLKLLPPPYQEFLAVGAVLGKEFRLELAAVLSHQSIDEAWCAVEEARRRHIVWSLEASCRYVFVHDKLRDVLLEGLPDDVRRQLHLRAAQAIREEDPDSVFEIAYHFDAGGRHREALPYALAAAERARHRHSLGIALDQYRIARRGVDANDAATIKKIGEGIGDVHLLRGEYEAAHEEFRLLYELATTPLERSRIAGKLGEIAFRRGDVNEAARATEQALRLIGRRVPSSDFGFFVMALWELFVQVLHTVLPRFFVARRSLADATDEEFLTMRHCSRLAYVYWFQRGKFACAWTHLREMNLAERYPPTPELAQAYSEHAPVSTLLPYFSRGMRYSERGLAIRRSLGDLWGEGQSLHFYGVVLYGASRFEDSVRRCREGVRLLERTGDRWEVNTANWHIGFALYRQGDLAGAADMCRRVHYAGLDIDDLQAAGIGLGGWARAALGAVPPEVISSFRDKMKSGDGHTKVEVLQAEGMRLIDAREYAAAVAEFREAEDTVRRFRLRQDYVATVPVWLTTALRLEAEEARGDATPVRFQRLLKEVRGPLRRALRLGRWYRNNLPHALREAGLIHALRGRNRRARRCLDRSWRLAVEQGARWEVAQTLLARGRIGQELGWKDAREDLAIAAQLEAECRGRPSDAVPLAPPAAVEISATDRLTGLLEVGRALASARDTNAVWSAVADAACRLLRAEHCRVFRWIDGELFTADGEAPVSGAHFLREAIHKRETVVWTEQGDETVSDSVVLARLRSALGTPILVRGQPAGCFYATHARVGSLFGEEEQRLAEFIAAMAGVALDNALSFEEREQDFHRLKAAQDELAQRAQELSRSNADLERFAYVASHDLKEPLRMVTNYVQLLERRYRPQLDGDALQFIEFASQGASRMYQLIDALLTYSQVGADTSARVHADLGQVLVDVQVNLRVAIAESGARLELGELPTLLVHRTQMLQLFQNLVSNSLKFRGPEAPVIRVSAEKEERCWHFRVQDNGIGIESAYQEKVFHVFKRLHRADEYPGTGIGLAICKRIIEFHQGRIWVESQKNAGATFHFTLPA